MSKDNNLRLLGSPVNLTFRGKRKEDKKNTRNRPRSALQNSCFTPDIPEKYKRPFSADAKHQAPSTRSFLKSFSAEVLQSYRISPSNVKVVPPTAELLASEKQTFKKEKDLCSNASDYGSEDTYISLGTKIKDKAQSTTKTRNSNQRSFLKYRSIARRGRKNMDLNNQQADNDKTDNYGLEVKIIEKAQRPLRSPSPPRRSYFDDQARSLSPAFTVTPYDSYFVPLDSEGKDSLIGRVSFGDPSSYSDAEHGLDACSRRSNMIKQQLSLVEEESIQDLESIRSHNNIISRQNSKEELNQNGSEDIAKSRDNVTEFKGNAYPKTTQNDVGSQLSYGNFYDDFRSNTGDPYKLSSTVVHTDTSSKDSGYPDSGTNDEKSYRQSYSLPQSCLKKSYPHQKLEQPKSLESGSTDGNTKNYHIEKNTWAEPLNHSRLLYKDFFLKKEGHVAVPPNNSPTGNKDSESIPGCSQPTQNIGQDALKYPSYLLNSTTKAYTSKVIEDYKKELEAINNLHELTIKDMQTDAISPTPLNLDRMFDEHSIQFENDIEKSPNSLDSSVEEDLAKVNENELNTDKRDVSKVSTKELINNYLKVKEGDYPRNVKKFEKKVSNVNTTDSKQDWNNKSPKSPNKTNIISLRNQNTRNVFTVRTPLSARIDGVQNDKDIDSWMSLTAPSPRVLESDTDNIDTPKSLPVVTSPVQEEPKSPKIEKQPEVTKPKELNPGSTVLDIYSMLKEIESYGDHPVTSVSKVPEVNTKSIEEVDEKSPSPRDNFMEIFEFLEKVEQSANDALSVVTNTPQQSTPKLEVLLKLPQTELAQRLVTASLQLEERSCCIALLQESLASHKEQMINKVNNLEKQSYRNISKVKQECEEAIKRHQNFIDQLINDKKTLNHRIEQLVEERRSLEERWKRAAQALEERYKLQLKNQHDKMAAAQQVARQRWVRQKAEKIKELTVKGLEGELREMAERQQKEIADLKMSHAEQTGRIQAKHAHDLEELRRSLEEERETALVKERQVASARMEKQILELELTYQEQRTRLVSDLRAENERVAHSLSEREREQRHETEKWREDQEKILEEKRRQFEADIAMEKEKIEEKLKQKQWELEQKFEQYKRDYETEQQMALKKKVTEIAAQHKLERDREIEKAIESMEAEAQAGRKELQEALRRNKEQYELELKELAQTEQATLRRYQDSQARIRLTEDKCAEMEITISQLETRNRVLTEKTTQLEQRAEEIRSACEETWKKKVDALVKEAEDTKKTHDEQMHQLYAKVKVAVARKDSAIQALTREAGKYQEKITLLEQKLQQQRKDFLAKK